MKLTYATRVIILLCTLLAVCLSGWYLSRPEPKLHYPACPEFYESPAAFEATVHGRTEAEIIKMFGEPFQRIEHVQDDGAPAWEYRGLAEFPNAGAALNVLIIYGPDGRVDRCSLRREWYWQFPKPVKGESK